MPHSRPKDVCGVAKVIVMVPFGWTARYWRGEPGNGDVADDVLGVPAGVLPEYRPVLPPEVV